MTFGIRTSPESSSAWSWRLDIITSSISTRSKPIVSAVLAVLLWPLVLFGINLHPK
jgi:hypothetical protein